MKILVTARRRMLGNIIAEELLREGHKVIVLDNLRQGHREAVPSGADFVPADICDEKALEEVFRHFRIDAVMPMAAETLVECSMTDPRRYFEVNVVEVVDVGFAEKAGKDFYSSLKKVEFLIDSGCFCALLSPALAHELAVKPMVTTRATLANSRTVEIRVGIAYVHLLDREAALPVGVLGVPLPLLGVTALEGLVLKADPAKRTLELPNLSDQLLCPRLSWLALP